MRKSNTLKEYLFKETGGEFSISGGWGTSEDEAIIIELTDEWDAISHQNRIIKEIMSREPVDYWETGLQSTLGHKGKNLDKREIFTINRGKHDSMYLYFDITKSWGNNKKMMEALRTGIKPKIDESVGIKYKK